MSGIAPKRLREPTTEAEVLELLALADRALAANAGPDDGSQPERRRWYEENRRRHEELRRRVRDLLATMRPGDELRFYEDDEWTGLALVRSGAIVGHVPYHETSIPNCFYELIVHFAGPRASARELMSLRKLDPSLRDTPLQSLVALVGDSPNWNLGRFYVYNVEDAERRCREMGLRTERI
jgi:hypothetical protein